jgi:hypothetical protein
MKTDSQPAVQPVTTEYMYCAVGDVEPTHAMPWPPKVLPLRSSDTRSAPTLARVVSMLPKVAASKLPESGEMALRAVESSTASL